MGEFLFLSTLSLRRATILVNTFLAIFEFLSTLSLRRATSGHPETRPSCAISIHALLAESDPPRRFHYRKRQSFLSTLSLRRATWGAAPPSPPKAFLSTLSLRRATTWQRGSRITYVISIHALLAESDHCDTLSALAPEEFLSTLSLRRATPQGCFWLS